MILETLNKLTYLEFSACVSCKAGSVSLDMTPDGLFSADVLIDCNGKRGEYARKFKKSEVDKLVGYLGDITEIITLDHETDEEIVYTC